MIVAHTVPKAAHILVILWLLALLLCGAYLRVHGVSEYYYNPDELSNIAIAKGNTVSDVIAFSKFETHPPYPAILRHFLMKISDSPEFLRGESAFFGLLCILVYYAIGKNAGGILTGCIAAFLVTFSYGNILQSQVVRNYTMLAFFLGCTYWCYQRFISSKDARYAIAYATLGLLSLMIHYSAIFMCFSVYIVSAFFMLRDKQFTTLRIWTIANLIIAAYFGYQYFTEIQHNAYEEFWKADNQLIFMDPTYNTFVFRLVIFGSTILYTSIYAIYASSILQVNYMVVAVFFISLYTLYFLKKRFLAEVVFALLLGASLTAFNIYPYFFKLGNRHSIWFFPYIIIPLSILFSSLTRFISKEKKNHQWAVTISVLLMAGAVAIYSTNMRFAPFYELQHTNQDQRSIENFMNGLTSQDLIVAGGLGTIGLLPDIRRYYSSLTYNPHTNWYFSDHRGNVPIVYTQFYPPLWNDTIVNSAFVLTQYQKAGAFNHIKYVWLFDSGWSHIWDDFIQCMVDSGNAIIRPEFDKKILGNNYIMQPKFIGIRTDVLLAHTYSCK